MVISLVSGEPLGERRLRQIERLGAVTYILGGTIPEPLLGSALSFLLRHFEIPGILHIGGPRRLNRIIPDAAQRFAEIVWMEMPMESDLPVGGPPVARETLIEPVVRVVCDIVSEKRWRGSSGDARVLPLHCGVDLDTTSLARPSSESLDKVRSELGVPRGAVVVTMVSDLVVETRPEDFVALAHRFQDRPDFFFLLVGDGPLAGTLGDLARFFRVSHFRHLSCPPDLDAVMTASDIFCTTSECEPLPFHLLTALAMKRPVVAAAVNGLDELINEGPCGRVVPTVGDLGAFEHALLELADPVVRRDCGEQGRRRVEERFDLKTTFEGWARLFTIAARDG